MTENEIILTYILKCQPIDLIINKPALSASQKKQFDEYVSRRASGEPLQYILGSWNFMGLELEVNPSVLIPRPETEQMVEAAIQLCKSLKEVKILDLGTGSGCIAISIAKACPGAQIVSVDISREALEVAKVNAKRHGVESRIDFVCADMSVYLEKLGTAPIFDLIISNPPYIPTKELAQLPKDVAQEPVLALDGGADGMGFYRSLIKSTSSLLKEGAYLMMEFGNYTVKGSFGEISQGEAIRLLLTQSGQFADIYIKNDLAGKERFIVTRHVAPCDMHGIE